ncbi:putative mitochondrial protein [Cucumis melo var. makuwa]|uniref:Mitochondrial protein n=1 Tax=Cucumis melo var. makuwa TaxID=1194695 RepID=A0A5D3E335_CUCMM|nr:putative mitochondrial protein [Cucumis melo var. makuwa]TYK30296.1 putative mitochondrial protein [Cucumis melo var. makuwa]
MDDMEELFFQSSVSTNPPMQTINVVPSVDTCVLNDDNSSSPTQKELTPNVVGNPPSSHIQKNHSSSSTINDPCASITTRKKDKIDYAKLIANICYTSSIEPTSVNEALREEL